MQRKKSENSSKTIHIFLLSKSYKFQIIGFFLKIIIPKEKKSYP